MATDDKSVLDPDKTNAPEGTGQAPDAGGSAERGAGEQGADGVMDGVVGAAQGGAAAVAQGFSAMRDVRRASKQSAAARSRFQAIRKSIDEDTATLEHRVDVEGRFERIVADETARLEAALAERDEAQGTADGLTAERDEAQARLDRLKKDNEERLRPYKNLMDTARGRADDAAKALSEARRAVKVAEGQVSDATSRRDARTGSSQKAVSNAEERLAMLREERQRLGQAGDERARAEIDEAIAAEGAALARAQAETTTVDDDTRRTLENAQTHLYTQRQSLKIAEEQHESAKRESAERKEEYERMHKEAHSAEQALDDQVVTLSNRLRSASKDRDAAQRRAHAAQELLDEANDIHATPQKTAELRDSIRDQQAALAVQQRQVDSLAATEKALRERTKRQRVLFAAVVAVSVVLVALLVLAVTGVLG